MFIESKSPIGIKTEINKHKIAKADVPYNKKDKTFSYVLTLKPDAPYDYLTIAGVIFAKKSYPTEAAESKNASRRYNSRISTAKMSERQATYIMDRAKKIVRNVEQNGVRFDVRYSDMIILEKVEDFIDTSIDAKIDRKLKSYGSNR